MFTTNWRVARMLRAVSLRCWLRRPELKPTIGGSAETKVKQLKGARLATPLGEMVETQAIGRGTTTPVSSL